jgi:hypothetical protein
MYHAKHNKILKYYEWQQYIKTEQFILIHVRSISAFWSEWNQPP